MWSFNLEGALHFEKQYKYIVKSKMLVLKTP